MSVVKHVSGLRSILSEGRFIVLLGPVGVGKSSVINVLVHTLSCRGLKACKLFIKAFHGSNYLLWRVVVSLLGLSKNYAPWYVVPMSGYRDLTRVLTIISAYIDALVCIPLKVVLARLLRFFGYVVVSEEYLHTALFDYLYSYLALDIKPRFYAIFPLHVLYSLALRHRPDLVVVLDADLRMLSERWRRRGYGDPQLKYVLMLRWFLRQRYLYNDVIIDTSAMSLAKTVVAVVRAMNRL